MTLSMSPSSSPAGSAGRRPASTNRIGLVLLGGALVLLPPARGLAQVAVSVAPRLGFFVPGVDLVEFGSVEMANPELEPGPTAGMELLLTSPTGWAGLYGSLHYAFSRLEHTAALDTRTAPQPSSSVDLFTLTGGLALMPPIWRRVRPRLTVGGGLKHYDFDLVETDGLGWFTFEYGVGVTVAPAGSWADAIVLVSAEFRQYVSTFQPATLPLRLGSEKGQTQFDNLFMLGFRFRLGDH